MHYLCKERSDIVVNFSKWLECYKDATSESYDAMTDAEQAEIRKDYDSYMKKKLESTDGITG